MNVRIRKMGRRDKPAVMDILRAAPEFLPSEVPVAEEVIDAFLNQPGGAGYSAYVATLEGDVCGYVCYGKAPLTEGTWDVYWIAVSGQWQGHGIGGRLMNWAETRIWQSEGRLVLVETSSKPIYEKTRRFYVSLGYEVVCTIPDFYASGDAKVVFQKRLVPHAVSKTTDVS